MLLRARRREADPNYMCGIAAEIFNRSPHMRHGARADRRARPAGDPARRRGLDAAAHDSRHVRVGGRLVRVPRHVRPRGAPVRRRGPRPRHRSAGSRRPVPAERAARGRPARAFRRRASRAGAPCVGHANSRTSRKPGHEAADVREVRDAERGVRVRRGRPSRPAPAARTRSAAPASPAAPPRRRTRAAGSPSARLARGMEQDVAAEHAGDRAARADVRHLGRRCRSRTASATPRGRRGGRRARTRRGSWRPRRCCRTRTGTACCRSGAASRRA